MRVKFTYVDRELLAPKVRGKVFRDVFATQVVEHLEFPFPDLERKKIRSIDLKISNEDLVQLMRFAWDMGRAYSEEM